MGQTYGNGVHAYFAGDYVKAHELLTKAIDAGSHDLRCYYFRGLAYLKLGRPQKAEGDFQQARVGDRHLKRTYNVARSLERVQGAVGKSRSIGPPPASAKLEEDEKYVQATVRKNSTASTARRHIASRSSAGQGRSRNRSSLRSRRCRPTIRSPIRPPRLDTGERPAEGAREGQVGTGHRGEEAGR